MAGRGRSRGHEGGAGQEGGHGQEGHGQEGHGQEGTGQEGTGEEGGGPKALTVPAGVMAPSVHDPGPGGDILEGRVG
jgi:hypothetical protein